jgi:predicted dienelactone hydrolase
MKWFQILAAGFLVTTCTPAHSANVGFQELMIPDGADRPLTIGVWYPTEAPATEHALGPHSQLVAEGGPVAGKKLPLVVISHGGGGSYQGHYDTAIALARAGFVAASVNHNGDTYDDQSQAARIWRRPAQLHRLTSYMLKEWPQHDSLDPVRVGAFGFSMGGFTVLVAAGGVPDISKTHAYCRANPGHYVCAVLKQMDLIDNFGADMPASIWVHDPRIRSAAIAAPAFGFAFDPASLRTVRIPIQLWRAEDDHHQPHPYYDEAVRIALPKPPDYHLIPNADHYDFLPPCEARLAAVAPEICRSQPGFDRAAFHEQLNAQLVQFFRKTLGE